MRPLSGPPRLIGGGSLLLLLAWLAGPVQVARAETGAPAASAAQPDAAGEAETADDADETPAFAASKLATASPPYPASIQASLDEKRQECLAEGGAGVSLRPGIVRTSDLNGDGRPDYVVDWREARCRDRLTAFNGTGGWDLEIYAGREGGQAVLLFAGRVRNYDLSGPAKARRVTFHLHGSYCGRAGTDDCVKARRIGQRPFAFRDR